MSEDSARFWSVIFGGVTTIGLVLGGTYTVIQYFDSRKRTPRPTRCKRPRPNWRQGSLPIRHTWTCVLKRQSPQLPLLQLKTRKRRRRQRKIFGAYTGVL